MENKNTPAKAKVIIDDIIPRICLMNEKYSANIWLDKDGTLHINAKNIKIKAGELWINAEKVVIPGDLDVNT